MSAETDMVVEQRVGAYDGDGGDVEDDSERVGRFCGWYLTLTSRAHAAVACVLAVVQKSSVDWSWA